MKTVLLVVGIYLVAVGITISLLIAGARAEGLEREAHRRWLRERYPGGM